MPTKEYLIEVSQEDINHGNRSSCRHCPVARALNRATGRRWSVGTRSFVELINNNIDQKLPYFGIPPIASEFIRRFDEESPVQPFAFTVNV